MKSNIRLHELSVRGLPLVLVVLTGAMPLVFANSALAQPSVFYSADAYGASAYVGNTINLSRTAEVTLGDYCGVPQVNTQRNGNAVGLALPPLLSTGVAATSAGSARNVSTSSAEVDNISVLSGLITGDAIKSVSTTILGTGGHLTYSATGSSLVNLKVLGLPINNMPAPNTKIVLPGIGRVVLNEQVVTLDRGSAHLTVNMIHVYVTLPLNLLGIPVGTEVVVASATSGIQIVPGIAEVDGISYGTQILGSLVQSSPTARMLLPCRGSDGTVLTTELAGIHVKGILTSGTITNTAVGETRGLPASSQTTSTVQQLSILSGAVKAGLIQAQANGLLTDINHMYFTASGSFGGLAVAGHPEINDNVADNTSVPLAGLGTLYLRRIVPGDANIEMRMIEVVINQNNVLGLPIGTDIIIGSAEASIHLGLPR